MNSKNYFSVGLICNGENLQKIVDMVQQHAQRTFHKGEYNTNPKFQWPWAQIEESAAKYPERAQKFPGHYLINAKAQEEWPPAVLDATQPRDQNGNLQPFQNWSQLVAGTYCYALVNCYDYTQGNNQGIAVGLNVIVVTAQCDPFKEGSAGDQSMLSNIQVTPMQGDFSGMPQQAPQPAGQQIPQQAPQSAGQQIPQQLPQSAGQQIPQQLPQSAGQQMPQATLPNGVPPINFNQ